ncbi:MAG: peptidase T [Vallitaleaceae bacterium]|jgi:tripeptide aminopeptidase|nr:peptidase T [Vallitaleaceae bacterium]
MTVTERFMKYIMIPTTSDESSEVCPSTPNQKVLAQLLVDELLALGVSDAHMDQNCYVMATIPSNLDTSVDTIGFISHLDTATDLPTVGINPRIIENYHGNVITLNEIEGTILSPHDFPELADYVGQDLIVTDGTTLLGADDKAGIAEIMTMAETLMKNPGIPHGTIKIGFTPDEEIGRGANFFDVVKFGADYAYTLDGGPIGELEFESFNANNLKITIQGRNVHPGSAKNQMINSMEIMQELHSMLPKEQKPQYTDGYEGFFHQLYIKGSVDHTETAYILRDHDKYLFEQKKELIINIVDYLNKKYGLGTVELDMKDMYYNMGEMIQPVYHIVDIAKEAMIELGIEPIIKPIRGGTDGARLSYMGLPCPNIFAGGHNFHGRHEFIPIQSMEMAVKTILKIIEKVAAK